MFDINKKIEKSTGFSQNFLDNEVLKSSNYFIPMDTGMMMESGIIHTKPGDGQVVWAAPQVRRLYYNPQYNFSTDKNPNAQGLWYEAAKSRDLKKWIDGAEKAFKKGF